MNLSLAFAALLAEWRHSRTSHPLDCRWKSESNSPAALDNLNKSSTGLYRQPWETGYDSFLMSHYNPPITKAINTCKSIHIFTWRTLRLNTWLWLLIEQMCLIWNLSVRADQTWLSVAAEVNESDSLHLDSNVALACCWSFNVPHIPLIRGIVGRFRESVSWTENRRSQLRKTIKTEKGKENKCLWFM